MPIKDLNSFLKSKKCSDKIKDDIKTIRRRLRNRGYAKKIREKKDEEEDWYQEKVKEKNKAILSTLKEIREGNKEMLIYINKYKRLCQETDICEQVNMNYNIMSPEEFRQETENLQYHISECSKLDKCQSEGKQHLNS